MSEAMVIPPLGETTTKRTPTVYFIDDSATMREVIKIAFRRENINVVTCADAASALAQFERNPPDAVITDVIMPDQDGYSVCSQIKQNPQYSATPVILMSGVVNKSVADKAVSVHADELIRKPFQPQELIGRVKSLLDPKGAARPTSSERPAASTALNSLFAPTPVPAAPPAQAAPPHTPEQRPTESVWPRALAEAFTPRSAPPSAPQQNAQPPAPQQSAQPAAPARPASSTDNLKLRAEIAHLELLIKKLQTELQIERQYNQALELQIKTLTQMES
jgi:twitching motility two-component system response regulator PilH